MSEVKNVSLYMWYQMARIVIIVDILQAETANHNSAVSSRYFKKTHTAYLCGTDLVMAVACADKILLCCCSASPLELSSSPSP